MTEQEKKDMRGKLDGAYWGGIYPAQIEIKGFLYTFNLSIMDNIKLHDTDNDKFDLSKLTQMKKSDDGIDWVETQNTLPSPTYLGDL